MHFKYNREFESIEKDIPWQCYSRQVDFKAVSFPEIFHIDKTIYQENKSILNLYASSNNFKIYKQKTDRTKRRNR